MSRETAFYPRLQAMTDQWMDLFGYWAPAVVSNTLEEYRACRETAALMDFTMLRKVDIAGPGALAFVNGVVTRDVSKLGSGQIGYGALCDENGKMIDDCTVMVRSADDIRFCGANDRDYHLFCELAPEGITVTEITDATPHLCLQGPLSRAMLQSLTDADLSNEAFPYYTFREDVEIAGIPVFMTRLGYTAELGYELWTDRDHALALWDVLVCDLAPQGMKVIGMDALDLFRIEGGFIIGGVEYDPTVSPYECALGWSVDLEKGPFQGREGIVRDREATTLRLGSVVLDSGGADASGALLFVDGIEIGLVTQAVESPFLDGQTLGLAKIPLASKVPGTKVIARVGGKDVPGEVVEHPVYEKERRKAKELG
ncbi:MAG: aminomethyltransferase family protein [Thermoleophilia bacterium]